MRPTFDGRMAGETCVALCSALLLLASVRAADAAKLFGGVYVHDVKLPTDNSGIESGADLSARLSRRRASAIRRCSHTFSAPLNTAGKTSYAAVGLSAKFGRSIYFRPGLGLAIHNGSAGKFYRTDKIAFGSRVLFEPEIALGTQINGRLSVEASWVHMSHAQLFGARKPGHRQSRRPAEPGALAARPSSSGFTTRSKRRLVDQPELEPGLLQGLAPSCAHAWRLPPHCRSRSPARAR